jgi:hypothetical protein
MQEWYIRHPTLGVGALIYDQGPNCKVLFETGAFIRLSSAWIARHCEVVSPPQDIRDALAARALEAKNLTLDVHAAFKEMSLDPNVPSEYRAMFARLTSIADVVCNRCERELLRELRWKALGYGPKCHRRRIAPLERAAFNVLRSHKGDIKDALESPEWQRYRAMDSAAAMAAHWADVFARHVADPP